MRSFRTVLALLIIVIFYHKTQGQDLPEKLRSLTEKPDYIEVVNDLEINTKGGHLQGVQGYRWQEEEYVYWSGSSDTYAYLVAGKLSPEEIVTQQVHIIGKKPLKHAGGFQIYQNWLAIGVEDNEARDRSQVQIYRLNNPESPLPSPTAVIERHGAFEEMTAGCVAITQLQEKILVAVGNWNTRNLDFYESELEAQNYDFIKTGSIEIATTSRENWSDTIWRSYQNINFYLEKDQTYLLGFASESTTRDVMDVFIMESIDGQYKLQKIGTKYFVSSPETSFRWGAGFWNKGGTTSVISCTEKLKADAKIAEYQKQRP